jgi:hypothetical protein
VSNHVLGVGDHRERTDIEQVRRHNRLIVRRLKGRRLKPTTGA